MKRLIILLLLTACDRQLEPDVDLREGSSSSSGDACEPEVVPLGSATETWACVCETSDDCKPGLQCVPLPNTKELRCLAPAYGETPEGGGYITSCKYGTDERALFYPFGINNSPAFCSACVGCSPPLAGSLICQ